MCITPSSLQHLQDLKLRLCPRKEVMCFRGLFWILKIITECYGYNILRSFFSPLKYCMPFSSLPFLQLLMPQPSDVPWFGHPNSILWITKLWATKLWSFSLQNIFIICWARTPKSSCVSLIYCTVVRLSLIFSQFTIESWGDIRRACSFLESGFSSVQSNVNYLWAFDVCLTVHHWYK
jgi:hypothetical protein